MTRTLTRITTLLVSVAILLTGHGLQLTLLPIYAESLGWSAYQIGLTGSCYFLGFVAGCIVVPSVVARVGHIRSFMVLASLAAVALLATGLITSVTSWILFRFVTGFSLAGLYMVIESWLSEVSPAEQRGSVLAVYTMICLLGMAAGQLLMGITAPDGLALFAIGAVFLCLAIIPIGLTRITSPQPLPALRFSPRILLRASRVAVIAALLGGMVTGAFWALGPVMGSLFGLQTSQVAFMMSAGVIGGALSQLPIGHLSDRMDRRLVIGGVLAVGAGVSLLGWMFAGLSSGLLYFFIFLIGAAAMPIYALCIAHANDNSQMSRVEITSGILMMNGLGSVIGPLPLALLMDRFGPSSFFAYTLACMAAAAGISIYRHYSHVLPELHEERAAFLPKTTQVVAELAPEPSDAKPRQEDE